MADFRSLHDFNLLVCGEKDLRGKDLSHSNLRMVDLSYTDLSYANLEGADLSGANLTGSTLYQTILSNVTAHGAIFKKVFLNNCIMTESNMKNSDFSYAKITYSLANSSVFNGCDFKNAIFFKTSLIDCFFSKANMTNADMTATNLINSYFNDAVLDGVDFEFSNLHLTEFDHNLSAEYRLGRVLDKPIIGYKKAIKDTCRKINGPIIDRFGIPALVTLEIPKGAVVFSINGSKCRTNKAIVLSIEYLTDIDDRLRDITKNQGWYEIIPEVQERPVRSMFDKDFFYVEGENIEIKNFNLAYNVECGNGIHFFMTKKEAIDFRY